MREQGRKNGAVEAIAGLPPRAFLKKAGVPV